MIYTSRSFEHNQVATRRTHLMPVDRAAIRRGWRNQFLMGWAVWIAAFTLALAWKVIA